MRVETGTGNSAPFTNNSPEVIGESVNLFSAIPDPLRPAQSVDAILLAIRLRRH
jgi:hypothetical protein